MHITYLLKYLHIHTLYIDTLYTHYTHYRHPKDGIKQVMENIAFIIPWTFKIKSKFKQYYGQKMFKKSPCIWRVHTIILLVVNYQ